MGRMVKIGAVEGYLGRPAGEGPWPTVIVIQEWWGLDNQTESIVDRLAGLPSPYFAFAPDLFHGEMALLGDSAKATALVEKYGHEHMRTIGRKGGKQTYQTRGRGWMRIIARPVWSSASRMASS